MSPVRSGVLVALAFSAGAAQAQSLYSEGSFRALAADDRALRPGDVLTVQVFESSSAFTSTDTSTERNHDIASAFRVLTPAGDTKQVGAGANVNADFQGGGRTERANRLLATLTVAVQEVLPNGDLRVGGRQVLVVNDEEHVVTVEGRVRPRDVSSENTVLSTRVADARITYVGDGALSERQRRGWWRALVDWLGF